MFVQRETDAESFKTSDLVLDIDGTVYAWKNAIFSKQHFTAEKELASMYTDISTIPARPDGGGDNQALPDANGKCEAWKLEVKAEPGAIMKGKE